jgi:hypothetical protein
LKKLPLQELCQNLIRRKWKKKVFFIANKIKSMNNSWASLFLPLERIAAELNTKKRVVMALLNDSGDCEKYKQDNNFFFFQENCVLKAALNCSQNVFFGLKNPLHGSSFGFSSSKIFAMKDSLLGYP